jgi:hypothetical protein
MLVAVVAERLVLVANMGRLLMVVDEAVTEVSMERQG